MEVDKEVDEPVQYVWSLILDKWVGETEKYLEALFTLAP